MTPPTTPAAISPSSPPRRVGGVSGSGGAVVSGPSAGLPSDGESGGSVDSAGDSRGLASRSMVTGAFAGRIEAR